MLFGKSYNRGRYEEIIEACALGPDLQMLPASDQTEIGEKVGYSSIILNHKRAQLNREKLIIDLLGLYIFDNIDCLAPVREWAGCQHRRLEGTIQEMALTSAIER